jgi:sarcosine oxidase subunit beta
MAVEYDVIIIGAGSVGVPTAMFTARKGMRTLVLDKQPSPGQGENKHSIGGIRATHSSPAKILTGRRSLEIFSTWEELHGDQIEWLQGGYAFPVYRPVEERALKDMLPLQKKFGLNIDFVGPEEIRELVPGINSEGLIGGTFSPQDGSASPLLAINAFYRQALDCGVEFRFKEAVVRIVAHRSRVRGVATGAGYYKAPVVVDAAGPYSPELSRTVGVGIPVTPDSHEAAITEPVRPFFECMVVDLRPAEGSKNYYFYQNRRGQVIFCITPDPPITGTDKRETSVFLPQVCARMVKLLPRLKNLRVRRVWRGLYPASPDGLPLVGWNRQVQGLLHATGMCGQGFMLGPGIADLVSGMVSGEPGPNDELLLKEFSPYRGFARAEALE